MVTVCIGEAEGPLVCKVSGQSLKGPGQGSGGHFFPAPPKFSAEDFDILLHCVILPKYFWNVKTGNST